MNTNPLLDVDFYKVSHKKMYVQGLAFMYSSFTPRNSKHFTFKSSMFDDKVVVFGIQVLIDKLNDNWNDNFFSKPIEPIIDEYKQVMLNCLGNPNPEVSFWYDLHKLGYLPVLIKALPEGTRCPMKVPVFTITNTDARFAWLVNYLETYLSTNIWKPMTMATNSYEYKRVINKFNALTADTTDFIPWQVHDFSARGLGNSQEWSTNSIAHLTSFSGTDTVQAILGAKHYYGADLTCGGSVPATEHSVMTIGVNTLRNIEYTSSSKLVAEMLYLNRLLNTFPTGIISVVCDSYDFWGVIEHNLPALKETILARDGKLVIRPDSGNPIDVICGSIQQVDTRESAYFYFKSRDVYISGSNEYVTVGTDGSFLKYTPTHEEKGLLQSLWDIFGGTINSKGYKVLDPHIGIIYGDAITPDVYEKILTRMKSMGFSSDNLVIGAGAVGNQLITRDTFGCAIKATHCIVDGKAINVSKEPKTDPNKKSAKGLLHVTENLELIDQCSPEMEQTGMLRPVFKNSEILVKETLENIRKRLDD